MANNKIVTVPSHRLQFVDEVLKNLGLTKADVSRLTFFSQQRICWWFKADDTTYNNLLNLFDQLDYNMKCVLSPKEKPDEVIIESPLYSLRIDRLLKYKLSTLMEPESPMADVYEKNGNLKFLAKYPIENELTLREYADLLGVNYYTVYNWFKADDIKISNIYSVAEKLDLAVSWSFEAKKN